VLENGFAAPVAAEPVVGECDSGFVVSIEYHR
jgi:hypothetical protein